MSWRRDLMTLLVLALLLVGLLALRGRGSTSCSGRLAELAGGPPPAPDAAQVAAALAAARNGSVAERIDVHLEWIARGSSLARASLHAWLGSDFPAGSLSAQQRRRLEGIALAWPVESLRQSAAGILLADAPDEAARDAAAVGCRALLGRASPEARADLTRRAASEPAAARWLASLGSPALAPLIRLVGGGAAGAHAGLDALVRAHPELRREAIPALIDLLEGGSEPARTALETVADERFAEVSEWRDWWEGMRKRLERLER